MEGVHDLVPRRSIVTTFLPPAGAPYRGWWAEAGEAGAIEALTMISGESCDFNGRDGDLPIRMGGERRGSGEGVQRGVR